MLVTPSALSVRFDKTFADIADMRNIMLILLLITWCFHSLILVIFLKKTINYEPCTTTNNDNNAPDAGEKHLEVSFFKLGPVYLVKC